LVYVLVPSIWGAARRANAFAGLHRKNRPLVAITAGL
jgi:hypothetical protein